MKISWWKRIKLFFLYRRLLNDNKLAIKSYQFQFNKDDMIQPTLRIDNVSRLYTVVNLPEEVKTYMSGQIVERYMADYIKAIDALLSNMGLKELIGLRDIKQLDETHYLIIFGYNYIDTVKFANWSLFISSILILFGFTWYIF